MSQGTLFATEQIRCVAAEALIKHLKLDVKISSKEDPEYQSNFPLNKVPAFIGPKGYKLTEVIAILLYLVSLDNEKSPLFGKNAKEYAQVVKWLSFGSSELIPTAAKAFLPLLGATPYNKKQVDEGLSGSLKLADILEERLYNYTYLVGERLTLADIFVGTVVGRIFETIWAKDFLKQYPSITRWFKSLTQTPVFQFTRFDKNFKFRDTPIEFVPPKKEKKQTQTQAQPKAKAEKKAEKKPEPEADEPTSEEPKKAKHPLEALGKSKIPIDEWKRVYSNEDTRPKALPWFWEHYDPSEWSLWKVGYKYNDELTLTFMSNNLVGGFFNRLSASTKFMFGCLVVYGENNNNGIIGAFLVRGQDFKPAFDVAPDWESYFYEKLDASNPADKEFVNDMWAWDKPVIVDGESKEIADGKVFK
ncbi:hypothetical protein PACTADRAFT_38581 [Pachysolen tannophilus NRRL Y-2460]|uniref:Elongation factor 1-gamma 1 n=1 Tax=Pachysolen tannophilus NRRL Y-2460 TaxID=669874 RepID=A0A1E4U045_PACTA|nr:hypothetical protein PACTADRAFT_38581 [Pachysolen tannophilus NRRL Y-2460]